MVTKRFEVTVELGKDFNDTIEEAIQEELRIAQNKWEVSLSPEQQDLVYSQSKTQLKAKLFEVFKHEYDFTPLNDDGTESNNDLDFSTVKCTIRNNTHIKNIPTKVYKGIEFTNDPLIQRTAAGFIVYNDDSKSDKTIHLSELATFVEDHMMKWVRAAVFYGVGSFT